MAFTPEFQSTHPARGGTIRDHKQHDATSQFQSTHPARGGTGVQNVDSLDAMISIHPPRTGWDSSASTADFRASNFNPPTPHGVGLSDGTGLCHASYFNPPTPHGVGRRRKPAWEKPKRISIHPPRTGWDGRVMYMRVSKYLFQSTHPARGGTMIAGVRIVPSKFQSTHPARGGTAQGAESPSPEVISIHPPRTGWDHDRWRAHRPVEISIHPPRTGWDFSKYKKDN